jgi:predicted TIM-barrel fold metal-dependent hydrolase
MHQLPFKISDFQYIDAHSHFFPERLFKAIWNYWERVYVPIFPTWHNLYQKRIEELVSFLKEKNVVRFTSLNYAHKKGVAEKLNEWTRNFCDQNPSAIPFGTAHPDDDNLLEYSKKALTEFNFQGFKFQLMVTDFYIYDSRLKPLHELIHDLDKILYVHAGTAPGLNQQPLPGLKVGVKPFLKYLNDFPENKVIVAHMGGYEYENFFKIVEKNENVYLDTTMIFIPQKVNVFPAEDDPIRMVGESRCLTFMEDNRDKILFGTDFPNIPYDYEESIIGLLQLNLSKKTYKNIFFRNAVKLFNLSI